MRKLQFSSLDFKIARAQEPRRLKVSYRGWLFKPFHNYCLYCRWYGKEGGKEIGGILYDVSVGSEEVSNREKDDEKKVEDEDGGE